MSGEAYELGLQVLLAPMKFIAVFLLVAILLVINFSVVAQRDETSLAKAEIGEVQNRLLDCVLANSEIVESRMNFDDINSCSGNSQFAIKIFYEGNDIVINEEFYSTYSGFCNRLSDCDDFEFYDINGKKINTKIVLPKGAE